MLIIIGVGAIERTYDSYGGYRYTPPGWIAVPIILIFSVCIYCLVTIIVGTVKSGNEVHRPALAIPFFRA